MTVTAQGAASAVPAVLDNALITVHASGDINPGDYVAFSGQYGIAVHDGVSYWKASGIGIALDRSPAYDPAGRPVVNSALLVARRGTFVVSASFSGQPNLGVLAFPDMTGSGALSGSAGIAPVWGTANPVTVSGGTGAAPVKAVAQVVGFRPGAGGTGQLEIALWDRHADYY